MKADSGRKEWPVFWDRIAGVYDLFVNVVNGKTHKALKKIAAGFLSKPAMTTLK